MRIGIFFSGNFIKNYEVKELQNLLKTRNKFIFFIGKEEYKSSKKTFISIIKNLLFKHRFFSLILIEEKISAFFNHKNSFSKKLKLLNKKIELKKVIKNFFNFRRYYFHSSSKIFTQDANLKKIIKKNCDMLIFLGFNKIVNKQTLSLPKKGILSFHTADINYYRGRPSGFYEFLNNEKYGGVTVQIIGQKIDSGKILLIKKTYISKCKSYQETLYRMMSLKENMLVNAIQKIKKRKKFHTTKNKVPLSLEKNSKKFSVVLKCLIKTILLKYFD